MNRSLTSSGGSTPPEDSPLGRTGARVGRIIVKQASLRVIQQTLRRIGIHVTQRTVGRTLSRWLPIIGPILIGGYSLMDTRTVGKTTIDTFSRQIEMEPDGSGDSGALNDLAT